MTGQNDATLAQIAAADPDVSTWVGANAGSGKTRVLTDRVARLLLRQTPPQKILCLTYTKAAAAHMQNQLFKRLGEWAMLPDAKLQEALVHLGEPVTDFTPAYLRNARTLFARALETPGGLKIQTIHSFCAALLRRFPLEAGVSPQFQEIDERSDRKLRADILEELADAADTAAMDGFARHLSTDNPDKMLKDISKRREYFTQEWSDADIWRAFGLAPGYDAGTYLAQVLPDWAAGVLGDLTDVLRTGTVTDIKNADVLAGLSLARPDMSVAEALENMFVFDAEKKFPNTAKLTTFPTKDLREAHPDLIDAVQQLMLRFEAAKPHRQALAVAERTRALHRFARAYLPEHARRKQAMGWLDFDDLILKARALLTESGMAQWVLFKMDGGIDHILVDEAQDTSPEQWAVVAKLAEEFSAGAGARDVRRTLFVVGDEKQSIYSFQGADPRAFDEMRGHFSARLAAVGDALEQKELLFSFRSSPAILRLVDMVMQAGGGGTTTHRAFYDKLPGRVDLWPFLNKPEKEEKPVWYDPVDTPAANDPALVLAKNIAVEIQAILDAKTVITTTKGSRPVHPGDFLILVQRRSDLFPEIIKALKVQGLPVAGADRLRVGAELAVRDLIALLAFLETPEDDLSLACALRSPLLRLSEQDLFSVAQGRKGWLWAAMRKRAQEFPDCLAVLNDLRDQTDFLRPYELLERILTRHGGRANLIARLGREAEEGIDALLTQALEYERAETPSLTGFLGWMRTDDSDIKRQMDAESRQIRVMTVHGAKGLESPIVILPDTAKRDLPHGEQIIPMGDGPAAWKVNKPDMPEAMKAALDASQSAQIEERQRLLYVALTRAESWLIVCGCGQRGKNLDNWYDQISAAMAETSVVPHEFISGPGQRYETGLWDQAVPEAALLDPPPVMALPDWIKDNALPVPEATAILSPSSLGGEKILAGEGPGLNEDRAKARGVLIHALLETLAACPQNRRQAVAQSYLALHGGDFDPADILPDVLPALENPALDFLFGPGTLSEVPVFAQFRGRPVYGFIDRLVVMPDRILAVDFKSNAVVPATAAEVPEGILRQMAAYAASLSQIWPDRVIETAVLWTRTGGMMPLPNDIVTQAGERATIS